MGVRFHLLRLFQSGQGTRRRAPTGEPTRANPPRTPDDRPPPRPVRHQGEQARRRTAGVKHRHAARPARPHGRRGTGAQPAQPRNRSGGSAHTMRRLRRLAQRRRSDPRRRRGGVRRVSCVHPVPAVRRRSLRAARRVGWRRPERTAQKDRPTTQGQAGGMTSRPVFWWRHRTPTAGLPFFVPTLTQVGSPHLPQSSQRVTPE